MLFFYRGLGIVVPAITALCLALALALGVIVFGTGSYHVFGWGLVAGFVLATIANHAFCLSIDTWAESKNKKKYRASWHTLYFVPMPAWTYVNAVLAGVCVLFA